MDPAVQLYNYIASFCSLVLFTRFNNCCLAWSQFFAPFRCIHSECDGVQHVAQPFAVIQVWQLCSRHTSMCDHTTEGRKSHGTYQTMAEINRRFSKASKSVRANVCGLSTTGRQAGPAKSSLLQLLPIHQYKIYTNPNFPRFCTGI